MLEKDTDGKVLEIGGDSIDTKAVYQYESLENGEKRLVDELQRDKDGQMLIRNKQKYDIANTDEGFKIVYEDGRQVWIDSYGDTASNAPLPVMSFSLLSILYLLIILGSISSSEKITPYIVSTSIIFISVFFYTMIMV
jgi:hypothetical protein